MSSQASHRLQVLSNHLKAGESLQVACSAISEFRYTLPNSILTQNQREFYERNGFLVVKGLVKPENIDIYREHFRRVCNGEVHLPFLTVMKDVAIAKSEFVSGEKAITKIQDFQHYEPLFNYCALPEILKYVECFCGPDIMAIHTMLINKPPDPGTKTSRHPMHQDLNYFPFRPADRIVCAWTAMEKVHRANGCLVVLPGTHTETLKQHEYPEWENGVNKFYYGVKDYDPNQPRLHLEMEKGDTVFFHPLLIHGSGANKTHGIRKAISCHYANTGSSVIAEDQLLGSQDRKEIGAIVEKRLGKDTQISIVDTWKMRARVVQGKEADF
ncbi:phytanoyl-CoA dioxygenase, peroxisomal-like [Watersipora subatra]|uniref:phytanoyl-CoA dioxygenase, peroxisomal-like n=1 Tax=Watersipora subatra TaxID=2589382 RepID=UPI00355BBCF1